ncbi:MAG: regulatory protein RecX [Candidatus Omnitrophota bacterium]|jgi:regulatory protein
MENYNKALNYSYLLLKYRPRARREIVERLSKKGYPSSVIDKVVSSLESYNYINDEEFTCLFVASSRLKGWGRKKIDYALKRFGITENLRKEALKDKLKFRQDLKELIKKKVFRYKEKKNAYQKIVRHFASRGFDYSDIVKELEDLNFKRFDGYGD